MSQIKNLPARYPELGRIRLGEKGRKTNDKGKEIEFPKKGEFLRFTSNDELVLKAIASQLGGDVELWPDGEQTYQLTTESPGVEVFLPPDPIDTSYERWGSGGVQKRCDGERCLRPVKDGEGGFLEEVDCLCAAESLLPGDRDDMKKGACQVTVRLRLVLPQIPGIGVWMCTSHSIYAAMELPGQVELLRAITAASGGSGLIPAEFAIEKRTEKKPWEKYARDFIVPVLRVRASLAQLAAGDYPVGELTRPAAALPAASEPAAPLSDAERLRQGLLPAPREPESEVAETGVAATSAPNVELADEWDRKSIAAVIAELDAEHKVTLRDTWESMDLPPVKSEFLTKSHVETALSLIGDVKVKQDNLLLARRIKAIDAMKDVGVTAEDARHELVREVTAGETESTKALTAAQLSGIVDYCAGLKAQDEGVSA